MTDVAIDTIGNFSDLIWPARRVKHFSCYSSLLHPLLVWPMTIAIGQRLMRLGLFLGILRPALDPGIKNTIYKKEEIMNVHAVSRIISILLSLLGVFTD